MDDSIHQPPSATKPAPKRFLAQRKILKSFIHWLVTLIKWTAEEREDAGIYLDRIEGE